MDEIKIARLETLLYNTILVLISEKEPKSEDEFLTWLEKETGLRRVEYDKLMRGESIC